MSASSSLSSEAPARAAREAIIGLLPELRQSMFNAARAAIDATPQLPFRLADDDLRALLNGFEAVMIEALRGADPRARRVFFETAIPALVAQGHTFEMAASATATFAVLISGHLISALDPGHQPDATAWLAAFFGDYLVHMATAFNAHAR